MSDSGVGNMSTSVAVLVQSEAELGVFVIALEVFSEETTALFNHIGPREHGAACGTKGVLDLRITGGRFEMASSESPAT